MTTNSIWAALRNPVGLLLALFLIPVDLFAWTNGDLLIWMDAERGQALKAIAAKKFENDLDSKSRSRPPRRLQTVSQLLRKWRRAPTLSSGRTIRSANGQTPD